MTIKVSIIVACSRPSFLAFSLPLFLNQTSVNDFEIIIVGRINELIDMLQEDSRLKLIYSKEGHPNKLRNLGIKVARASLIAFLDDDTLPQIGWIDALYSNSEKYSNTVLTGPEYPFPNANTFTKTVYKVASSRYLELTKGHIHTIEEEVHWYEVPFCNCVIPLSILQKAGGLDEEIPWHMDDFHFFSFFKENIKYVNIPTMSVYHDRYPSSLKSYIKYKWRLRTETGEKIITHPEIYLQIPPIKWAFIAMVSIFFSIFILMFFSPFTILLLLFTFLLFCFVSSGVSVGVVPLRDFFIASLVFFLVYSLTALGILYGAIRGTYKTYF